jgi:MAM domain, meprin/A5/mu/Ig-like domain CHU_C associated/CARDB
MKNIYLSALTFFFISLFTIHGFSQNGSVPELMYYKFDGSGITVPNGASTPVGTNPAPLTTVTQGGTGQFGGALVGAGAGSLSTGWSTSLVGDWTMSFWIDFGTSAATFQYFFGDPGSGSFRAFANGAAGVGNIVLRGPLSDVVVTGVADGLPHVVHFVYSSVSGDVKAYKDGILNNTVVQIVTIPTGTGMTVGAYTSSMQVGAKMDEFRLYNRALDQTEITDTWNNELPLSFAPDDVGVVSVGPPGAFCPGVQNVDATIQNYGTNQVDSFMVHWSINSVFQSSQSVLTPLDTFGGVGSHQTTLTLGTNNFILAQTYTIEAWTTLPNGVPDTITGNDSATTTLTVTVPGVNSLGASNIIDVAADINWTELGTAAQWHVELGIAGFTQGTGGKFFTTNNPHSLSGLTQNTLYDFYVRSICGPGDTSAWAGPGTFLTSCAISTAPFLENFDGASWTGPGIGSIDQCWFRDNTTTPYWQVDNNGTSSSNTGPALDASGLGKYVYLETSGGSVGDSSVLESPWIDFSTTLAPELSFEYHMFGASMGTMKVQASSDGSNWSNVWSISGQQHISDSDPWTKAIVSLASYSGDTAKVRFVGIRGTSFTGDMAIDEVRLREPPAIDIGLVAIDSPNTACGMDSIEDVSLRFASFGFDTINTGTNITMYYSINGGTYVSEVYTVTSDIFIGDTLQYTFTMKANLATPGNYNFKAFASIAGDGDPVNDTLEKFVASIPVINSFPYFENFDAGQGGWTSSGTNSTWAYGTPAKNTIIGASSGTSAWVTGGLGTGSYNANEVSYVTGPCFDLSTMVRPGFDLKVWWNSEFSWDGARLEASSDAGTTWNVIGNFGDPNNWYTDNSINGMPTGQQEGWTGRASSSNGSGGWVTAFNTDITFGGESDVFVRIGFYTDGSVQDDGFAFDDFQLKEDAVAIDLRLDSLAPINSNCGLSSTTPITVIITNYGQNTLTNIPVTYYIGGTPMATETITASLVGGQVFSYQFNQTADLSNPQAYILTASVDYVGDMDTSNNNSPPRSVVSYQVPTVIAFQGDEVCINGPANLFANTDIGVTRWYDAPSGGTILLTADNFPISNLTTTTTYYAEPFSPSIIPCVGIRQPVLADVSQIPQISFTGQQTTSLTIQFTSVLSSNTDSVWWDFGDLTGSDSLNPVHVYSVAGTKGVVLQGFDGSCDTSVSSAIFVLGLENGLASLIEIFPNPNTGSFQFRADDLGESINIQLLDQKGVLVLEENWFSDNGKYDRTVELPIEISAGIYHLRIVSGDRIGRIKIVKE